MSHNPFADSPITNDELCAYFLAQAVYAGIRDPRAGGPRGQMLTCVDTWYPQAKRAVDEAGADGNRGVLLFFREHLEDALEIAE